MTDFSTLGLDGRLVDAVKAAGYTKPTPIQTQAIPLATQGRDVLGLAQTGTGKTAAFGLPLVQALLEANKRPQPKSVRALVLAPTRELANQIADTMKPYVAGTPIRVGVVVGGQSLNRQANMLSRGLDLLVATPGRLIDLMDRGAVDLGQTRFLVLDEADQMLDMGFIHALRRIAPKLGTPRQTMLFSATMPKEMESLAATYLTNPARVQVNPPGIAADKVEQEMWWVPQADKADRLKELLAENLGARSLVFARTKHGAERLMKGLVKAGFDAASIHGNKSQGQRDRALKGFREGTVTVLVATDVAARGIDVPEVAFVYNFDLPNVPENYVHRIGRTARAGRDGRAISLVAHEEAGLLRDIQKVMGTQVPVMGGEAPRGPIPKTTPNGRAGSKQGKPGGRSRGPQKGGAPKGAKPKADAPKGQPPKKPSRAKRPRVRQKAA
ncbi:DEAD/DEAH box helicase [Jannaschia sp. Os4]|uniref:DEAD/DEAH box helicase n=1 Tax=Jannaschia sp. Os4 TaxID=2807617 RepID=UPI00193A60B4|nr:DEAD/DEAH box helicase [Jannaschia sp. Os4]MBM2575424.1 DEAD/DEAH box helicase [Jannaschia sp. Os4]